MPYTLLSNLYMLISFLMCTNFLFIIRCQIFNGDVRRLLSHIQLWMKHAVTCNLVDDEYEQVLSEEKSTKESFEAVSQVLPFNFTSHYFHMLWPRVLQMRDNLRRRPEANKELDNNSDSVMEGYDKASAVRKTGPNAIVLKPLNSRGTNPNPELDSLLKASNACDLLSRYDSSRVNHDNNSTTRSMTSSFGIEDIASICVDNESLRSTFRDGRHLIELDDVSGSAPRLFHMLPEWLHERTLSSASDDCNDGKSPNLLWTSCGKDYWAGLESTRGSVQKSMDHYRIEQPQSRTKPWINVLASVSFHDFMISSLKQLFSVF